MVDITNKISSLRIAVAAATIQVSKESTIEAIKNKTVPKGDVFSISKTAGLFGVKRTPDLIPDCHPIPVEFTDITFNIDGLDINILVEVATIYKTGVEVEAMTGASITALTMYDMLKPIDKGVEIKNVRLIEKQGGKSNFRIAAPDGFKVAILVVSDSIAAGTKEDVAGSEVSKRMHGFDVEIAAIDTVPDVMDEIGEAVLKLCNQEHDLILTIGGTGLSPRDVTPETIASLIDRPIPGIMEAARYYGQQRTPYAMLSRGVAGFKGNTLILTLPGSTKGALETVDALFPFLFHVFKVLDVSFKH